MTLAYLARKGRGKIYTFQQIFPQPQSWNTSTLSIIHVNTFAGKTTPTTAWRCMVWNYGRPFAGLGSVKATVTNQKDSVTLPLSTVWGLTRPLALWSYRGFNPCRSLPICFLLIIAFVTRKDQLGKWCFWHSISITLPEFELKPHIALQWDLESESAFYKKI